MPEMHDAKYFVNTGKGDYPTIAETGQRIREEGWSPVGDPATAMLIDDSLCKCRVSMFVDGTFVITKLCDWHKEGNLAAIMRITNEEWPK